MEVYYTSSFIKQYNKLNTILQDEVIEKIELFKNKDNHTKLKVHALHGRLKKYYGFSVNYSHRIVFEYISKNEVVLLKVGDHDIYEKN
jgi:mRNA-degrading endonuclease YafQ of YafQ-DinJ toxin-antitoxin module